MNWMGWDGSFLSVVSSSQRQQSSGVPTNEIFIKQTKSKKIVCALVGTGYLIYRMCEIFIIRRISLLNCIDRPEQSENKIITTRL